HDDIAKAAKMVGFGGLSGQVEETARIAMRGVGAESKAFGVDPDFLRDASSISFGRAGRTRDLLSDDPFGALGLSGERWSERVEELTKGLAPKFSQTRSAALAGLGGAFADRADLGRLSREALRAIRGVTPGLGSAETFDLTGF